MERRATRRCISVNRVFFARLTVLLTSVGMALTYVVEHPWRLGTL